MNYNSYPSSREEYNNQPNDSYNQYQEAMKDVEFQGGNISSQINQEVDQASTSPEIQEKPINKVEKILGRIQGVKDFIKKNFDVSNSETLVEMADDALVHVAKETIAAADKDGVRTHTESIEIEEAVSSVVVQGAMEEAGIEQSAGNNPILE